MNQYFTEVDIKDPGWKINHRQKIMMMGSCFAENIGERMLKYKFQVDLNPFGVLYNPLSIAKSLRLLMAGKVYKTEDLFEHDGLWKSFDHHSKFSSVSAEESLARINEQIRHSRQQLKESSYLILSLGTAWAYELKRTGEIVSNCHKLPASSFKRFRLSPGEIVEGFKELISNIWKFNPNLKILFTVSPVRHWKDGAVENQLSKSTLLLAVDRLVTGFGEEKCAYFPSFEIVMDELRDYRFYARDMLHLSEQAVDHIWQKFSNVMLGSESSQVVKKLTMLIKARGHRVMKPGSEAHRNFLLYNLNEVNEILNSFPFLDLENEKNHFEMELGSFQGKSQS